MTQNQHAQKTKAMFSRLCHNHYSACSLRTSIINFSLATFMAVCVMITSTFRCYANTNFMQLYKTVILI